MVKDDWGRFVQAMTRLEVALDQPQTKERINIFWDAFRTTRIEAIEWACLEAEKTLIWFPKPKELADLARMAPLPALESHASEQSLIEDLQSPDEQRANLRNLAEKLNRDFGTSFAVGDELGRPVLVSHSERDCDEHVSNEGV